MKTKRTSSVAKSFDPGALNWPVGLILLVASITILITSYADWLSDEQATWARRYAWSFVSPASGRPVTGIRSVTVVGPDSTTMDALSTSVFVMGVEKRLSLVESLPGVDVVITDASGRTYYSSGLLRRQSQ